MPEKIKNFIGGEFVEPLSSEYMAKISPISGEIIYELPNSNELDAVMAIKSAHAAFEKWSKTSVEERSNILLKIADIIEERLEDLALAEVADVGKPLHLAKSLDIPRAARNFRFFATRILHKQEQSSDMDGEAINYVLRQPVGVAGLISPWNLPLYLLTWKIAPALACGNTVVCKPSEFTSKTAFLLGEILNQAGLPKGVCNIIFGKGERAGRLLCEHPGVPLISFTGGTATGSKIAAYCAPHFKKTSLELGGKNATIILNDVDLKKIIPTILRSAFLNQGEICLCGSKILVQEQIYDEFCEVFSEAAKLLIVGDPMDAKTFMCPLISADHLKKVSQAVALARKEKAKILAGGERPALPAPLDKGFFFQPTVIADLTACSELHQYEIFGPVVTINSFKYVHEAVKLANNSPYGLSASVWTKDLARAHKVAASLNVGTVWINTWMLRDLRMPFGGTKASGLGREGGDDSFDFYSEKKTVCVKL
jgi:aminomuconate-semialdehyde/2-hydroxymuconate-6-semialdehyde dehydrogenase